MANIQQSRKPVSLVLEPPPIETIGNILTRIAADPKIKPRRAGEIRSGVITLCRALGTTPNMVPADPAYFAARSSRLTPGLAQLSAGRLRNCRSLVEAALDYAARLAIRRRSTNEMSPAFAALYKSVDEKEVRVRLGRFFRYATAHNLTPDDITTELFDTFLEQLTVSGDAKAKRVDRDARNAWNKAAASVLGWPGVMVAVPRYTDHYVLPLDAFPASFADDLDAYIGKRLHNPKANPLDSLDIEGLFDGPATKDEKKHAGPVGESTAALIAYQIRQFASVLVIEKALKIEEISSLASIVTVPLVKLGLTSLIKRAGTNRNSQNFGIANKLAMVARHWLKLPETACRPLEHFASVVRPVHEGLPESARRSLAPLRDPENVRSFLTLPDKVFAELAKIKNPTSVDANIAASALWIAIAQRIPLRISNLVGIDIEKNLLKSHNGKHAPCALYFKADDVKNDVTIEAPLSPRLIVMIDTFVTRYRKLLTDMPSTALFPAKSGSSKKPNTMSSAVQKLLRKRLGFAVNPHSFRHVAAMLFLSVHPDAYAQVQLLLGHRKLDTTIKYYCELKAEDAFKHFDEVLLGLSKEKSYA